MNTTSRNVIFLTIAAISSASCGTTYSVSKADLSKFDDTKSGLYYYLPETQINLEAVVVGKGELYGALFNEAKNLKTPVTESGGTLATFEDVYEHNLATCDQLRTNPSAVVKPAILPKSEFSNSATNFAISEIYMSQKTVPDYDNLYRLDIDADMFSTFSHTINTNKSGVIISSKNTITDSLTPVIVNSVKSIAELANPLPTGLAGNDSKAYCVTFNQTIDVIRDGPVELQKLRDERYQVLPAQTQNVDGKYYELVVSLYDEQIVQKEKEIKEAKAQFEKSSPSQSFVLVGSFTPNQPVDSTLGHQGINWQVFQPKFEAKKDDETPKRISFLPGTASSVLVETPKTPALQGIISALKVQTSSKTALALSTDTSCTLKPKSCTNQGYRYRIPVFSNVNVLENGVSRAKTEMLIAQYGQIATLPSEFNGSEGTLNLDFDPDTGMLSAATIGATAQSDTLISDSIGLVNDYRTAERARDIAKETENEGAAQAAISAQADLVEARTRLINAEILEIEAERKRLLLESNETSNSEPD